MYRARDPLLSREVAVKVISSTDLAPDIEGRFQREAQIVAQMDHPGIVYLITGILSSFGINIESMETKTYAAPGSGTPIFRLESDISVPTKTNINALRERFAAIQKEENIDIEFAAMGFVPDELTVSPRRNKDTPRVLFQNKR